MEFKNYINTKEVLAVSMNLGDYHNYIQATLPFDKDPTTKGYLIKQQDGHVFWYPDSLFKESYQEVM